MDRSWRLSVRPLLARLGWRPGDRVSIDVFHRAVVVVARAGRHALGSRGDLALPVAARQLGGIGPGQPVLVAACPARGMLVIQPVDTVTALLAEFHTQLIGDRDAGWPGSDRDRSSAVGAARCDGGRAERPPVPTVGEYPPRVVAAMGVGSRRSYPIEADHGQLTHRLRPMRGLRTDRTAQVIIAGHAFMQNVRRGHYEIAVGAPRCERVAAGFTEIAPAI